jgi:DHA1 family quinolone resistance protein-like MFS transporter
MSTQAIGEGPGKVLNAYITNQTFHWFIVGLTFPVLVLLVLDKGLNIFEAGTVMAIYSGTAVLLELPTGGLADSIGRKRTYILSVGFHMAALTAFLLSFDYLTVALAALLMGTGRALSSGSVDAWFIDEYKRVAPGASLQRALAHAYVFTPLGLGAGALIGGLLPMAMGGYLADVFGASVFAANLLAALTADGVQIVLTERLIHEHVDARRGGLAKGVHQVPEVVSTSMRYGVQNRTVLVLLMVMVAFGFGISGLELLWQPRISEIMGTEAQTWVLGVLAAAYFAVTAAGNMLITPVCARAKNDYLAIMTGLYLLFGLLLVVLAAQNGILLFATMYLAVYLVIGMTESPYAVLYNEQVPEERRSTMLSFQSLTMQGGGLLGSVILGFVAGSQGIASAWTVAAAVVAISSLGFVLLKIRARRSAAESISRSSATVPGK